MKWWKMKKEGLRIKGRFVERESRQGCVFFALSCLFFCWARKKIKTNFFNVSENDSKSTTTRVAASPCLFYSGHKKKKKLLSKSKVPHPFQLMHAWSYAVGLSRRTKETNEMKEKDDYDNDWTTIMKKSRKETALKMLYFILCDKSYYYRSLLLHCPTCSWLLLRVSHTHTIKFEGDLFISQQQ